MTEHKARSRDWFQIISNVAIIVSLGLVVYELRQSKQLAHAQMTDELIGRITQRNVAIMGEDPRGALAKAALRPSDLNPQDAVTLEILYREVVNNWVSMYRTEEISGVDRPWEGTVAAEARRSSTSKPGRRWLGAWVEAVNQFGGQQKIAAIAEQTVERESTDPLRSAYELLLANH